MVEVIVYQMGKVGSTAICRGLQAAGITAAHSHFLGGAALVKVLNNLLEPDRTEAHIQGGISQIGENLRLTRLVNAHRAGEYDHPLRIVTLTRDPLNWYLSFLVQSHAAYEPLIRIWAARNGHGQDSFPTQVQALHERLFGLLGETPGMVEEPTFEAAIETARRTHPGRDGLVGELLLFLRMPIIWFWEFMVPVTGIDPVRDTGEVKGATLRFRSPGVELLLIPFERLQESVPVLAEFAGLAQLELPSENVTAHKTEAAEYAGVAGVAERHSAALGRLYDSTYARRFGYQCPYGVTGSSGRHWGDWRRWFRT
jgi:hypothetical protein